MSENDSVANRFDIQPTISNHFSWLRTRFAIERTFMAWMRTSVSLIGFGFTIVQFFQRLKGMEIPGGKEMAAEMPRNLGLALIAAGIGSLLISAIQYHAQLSYLWSPVFQGIAGYSQKPHKTPAFISAVVLMLIGITAFVSVFFHLM